MLSLLSFQLDADRDEEEVFCDISMTLDNKLFPSEEPAAGELVSCAWGTQTQTDPDEGGVTKYEDRAPLH